MRGGCDSWLWVPHAEESPRHAEEEEALSPTRVTPACTGGGGWLMAWHMRSQAGSIMQAKRTPSEAGGRGRQRIVGSIYMQDRSSKDGTSPPQHLPPPTRSMAARRSPTSRRAVAQPQPPTPSMQHQRKQSSREPPREASTSLPPQAGCMPAKRNSPMTARSPCLHHGAQKCTI